MPFFLVILLLNITGVIALSVLFVVWLIFAIVATFLMPFTLIRFYRALGYFIAAREAASS